MTIGRRPLHLGAWLLCGGLAACAGGAHPAPIETPSRALPEAPGRLVACKLHGTAQPDDGRLLFADTEQKTPIARFRGHPVAVDTEGVTGREGPLVRARFHVPAEKPGLTVTGWIDGSLLRVFAARDIDVLAPYARLVRGASVRFAGGSAEGRVRVEPLDSDFDATVETACDALTLELPAEGAADATDQPCVHLAREALVLFDAPDREAVLEVRARRASPTLLRLARRPGMTKVLSVRGLRVEGWVKDTDIAVGEGPDCDDCGSYGIVDAADLCPVRADPDDPAPCPDGPPQSRPIRTRETTDVRSSPRLEAPVIGTLEGGADVFVFQVDHGFARVGPASGELREPKGRGFWVRAGSLEL